jgi:hypothetical protein
MRQFEIMGLVETWVEEWSWETIKKLLKFVQREIG